MIRGLMLAAVAVAMTVSYAQAQDAPKHRRGKPAPAAEKAAAAQDDAPLPEKMQKWFGNTVDDILTGADDALGPDKKK